MDFNELKKILFKEKRPSVVIATSNLKGQPNAAPRRILKASSGYLYIANYPSGKTWNNIVENPLLSITFTDKETLSWYNINGTVQIIEEGTEYDELYTLVDNTLKKHTVNRIIEGVKREKTHQEFIFKPSRKPVIFKILIKEIIRIDPQDTMYIEE